MKFPGKTASGGSQNCSCASALLLISEGRGRKGLEGKQSMLHLVPSVM